VPSLSPLVSGQILRVGNVDSDSLIFWRQDKDLLAQLKVQLEKFGTERTEIREKEQGNRYFRSLGRRQDLVFLSNAADSNDFAKVLSAKLRLENITHFQYKAENNFTLGEDWEQQLSTKVESSRVFAMLITPGYPQSQWCQFEYKRAEGLQASGRLKIIPYFLQEVSEMKVRLQGRDLRGMSPEQQASIIAADLDNTLTVKDPVEVSTVAGEAKRRAAEWQNGPVDLAIVTIRPEEFGPVLKRLDRTWRYRPTKDKPDLGAWHLGEVTSPAHERSYKVVVSMAARRGNISGEVVTRRTIERWEPRYVVLAGIAGGLPINELAKGDVVVSSVIYAYEYGKIHKKFAPRHDFIYQVDDPLVRNALALALREPHWAEDVRVERPEAGTRPKILDGPLASGDKLVDDITNTFFADVLKSFPKLQAIEMEGAGAASAIQAAREEARVVGFLMIRGISDMPRSGAAKVSRVTKKATGPSEGANEQSKQRDLWKDYAADTAASVAIQLLRYGWPVPPA
jgi:nucleoside phosphorylase